MLIENAADAVTAAADEEVRQEIDCLLLASLREHTGNSITAARLADAIGAARCPCRDVNSFSDAAALRTHLQAEGVDLVVGIHAYRSGRLLVGCGVPYALVLGGTDMNCNMAEPEKRAVMEVALQEAGAIIAFNCELLDALLVALPSVRGKTHLVPQAIRTCVPPRSPGPPSGPSALQALQPAHLADGPELQRVEEGLRREEEEVLEMLDVRAGETLLLLPAGLRPVKDVLFAACAMDALHENGSLTVLRIVGPALDHDYSALVQQSLASLAHSRAVAWCGPLPQRQLHLAMRSALAVVNTSTSEGMCNSLLEAFVLGTPVLARNIAGNAALVKDGETGMLFDTPESLLAQAQRLLGDVELRRRVAVQAQAVIARQHSAEGEARDYSAILQGMLRGASGKARGS